MNLGILWESLISSLIAFSIGLISIYSCHHLAKYTNLLDKPDRIRKFHDNVTPTSGGIGITIAFIGGLLMAYYLTSQIIPPKLFLFLPYFSVAALLMVAMGLYDDIHGLSSKPKFIVQIVAAVITCMGLEFSYMDSLLTHSGFGESLVFKAGLYAIFSFWIVLGSNSINLIDGVDGLASTLTLLIIFGLSVIGLSWGVYDYSLFLYPLGGAVVAFLIFNRPPASIFMGDTGSLLIGYVLGTITLLLALQAEKWMYGLSLLFLFGMPLLDTLLSVIRRIKRNINPFESDSNHIHHVIQRHYKSPAMAVISIGLVSLLFIIISISLATTTDPLLFWLIFGMTALTFGIVTVLYHTKLNQRSTLLRNYSNIAESGQVRFKIPLRSLRNIAIKDDLEPDDKENESTEKPNRAVSR